MPKEYNFINWRGINSIITNDTDAFAEKWATDALLLLRKQDSNKRRGIITIQPFELIELKIIDPLPDITNFFLLGNN